MKSIEDRMKLVTSTLIDHIARVDLQVQDLHRSLAFYEEVVGLEVAERSEDSADLRSAGSPVILRLTASATSPADPRATGLFHTAIRFPTRMSLGDALARLVAANLDVAAGDHLVSEALYVDDPDGNGVELYWDRPVEEWPPPANGMMVPMATLPVDLRNLLNGSAGRAALGASAPPGTDVGHVHLQVSDVEETIDFYTRVLGLDLVARMGSSAGFFSSRGYHHNIGANSWQSRGSSSRVEGHAGLERVVFGVAQPEDLQALRVRVGEQSHGDSVFVQDPDGIELEFVLVP